MGFIDLGAPLLVYLIISIYDFPFIDIYGYSISRLVGLWLGDPLRDLQNHLIISIDEPCLPILVLIIPPIPANDLKPDPSYDLNIAVFDSIA